MKIENKKTGIFLLTAVQQMLPTLTLQWPKLVWNIKTRICCPSWIWAFGISSRFQSQKLQKLKLCPWSKDLVLHLVDKTIYAAVFTREKRMFCSIMAPGDCCTTHVLLVYFYQWTGQHHWLMDACLVSFCRGRQQSRQFMLYLRTVSKIHKIGVFMV